MHSLFSIILQKLILSLLLLLSFCFILSAQSKKALGFQLGYRLDIDNPVVRDDGLVRLAFKGIGGSVGLAQKWHGHDFTIESDADLDMNYLSTRYGNPGARISFLVQAVTSHTVIKFNNSIISAGIPLVASIDDWYLFSWDDAHLYWLTAYWTGLSANYDFQLANGVKISGKIKSPLTSFVSRPPEYRKDKQEGIIGDLFTRSNSSLQPVSVNRYRGIDLEISCAKMLRRSELSLNMGYSYRECSVNAPAYVSRLFIGVTQLWKAGK